MPKRTSEEKMQRYTKKLKKLEKKLQHKPQRRVIYSDSDSDVENPDNDPQNNETQSDLPQLEIELGPENHPGQVSQPELAAEFLDALGDAIDDAPKYGEEIHSDLAQRWISILRKGLPKDMKEKLLKEYLIPSNCKYLKAPTLNLEISAAITDSLRNRDKKLECAQDQLGKGITAINQAITLLLTNDDKIQPIKILSDATRILSDLHHYDTNQRVKLLTPNLDKSFLNMIENSEGRDETLFGDNLGEKIKIAKTIERQGLSIKKTAPVVKPTPSTSGTSRPRQGNWSGPSRFQAARGGRTAHRMTTSTPARRGPPPTAPSAPARPTYYAGRNRAPQRR